MIAINYHPIPPFPAKHQEDVRSSIRTFRKPGRKEAVEGVDVNSKAQIWDLDLKSCC